MILESIVPEDIKARFVISVDEDEDYQEYNIGRARTEDVKINLDSISRSHARITYNDGWFYLTDCESTFGTMVLLEEPVLFQHKKKTGICLQSGPTLFEIQYETAKKIEETYVNEEGKLK